MTEQSNALALSPTVMAQLEAYCAVHETTPSAVVTQMVGELLAKQQPELADLIQGYVEMASLNTEICHEFIACENEAYAHIR